MARKNQITTQDQAQQEILEAQVPESRKSEKQPLDAAVSECGSEAFEKFVPSRQTAEAKPTEPEQIGQRATRKSTGPRTARGKARSKLNATKHGMLFKGVLLEGESSTEYFGLLNGLREDYQLQGKLADVLIENLAVLLWRQCRFFRADAAAISGKIKFMQSNYYMDQYVQAWDCSRLAIASGGLLKYIDNPVVLKEAIDTFGMLRTAVIAHGLKADCRYLKKLYGEDLDGGTPYGLPLIYEKSQRLSEERSDESVDAKFRKSAVEIIDREIERLKELEKVLETDCQKRIEYKSSAAIIPNQDDHLLRYETHLSRQIDRILNRLERLQRTRKG